MEIHRVTKRNDVRQQPDSVQKPASGIEIIKVSAGKSTGGLQPNGSPEVKELQEKIRLQDNCIEELRQLLDQKKDKADRLRAENEQTERLLSELESEKQRLEAEACEKQAETERLVRRQSEENQKLEELRRMERMTDGELAKAMKGIGERYALLSKRQLTVRSDLEKDLIQLCEMKSSEFADAAKLKALEEKFRGISEQMEELERELSRLSLGAGREGVQRTSALNIEE